MRTLIATLLLLLSACGTRFDLDAPISIVVEPLGATFSDGTPWLEAEWAAHDAALAALRQLWVPVAGVRGESRDIPGSAQTITIARMSEGDCKAHAEGGPLLGYNFGGESKVYLCAPAFWSLRLIKQVVRHEIGHVLGAGHTPCAMGGIMPPQTGCNRTDAESYTFPDLREICESGRVMGGICGR